MNTTHRILLLARDAEQREHWKQRLEPWASVSCDVHSPPDGESHVPDVIVTDQLPIAKPLGSVQDLVAAGEVGIVGVGTQAGADVVLPEDARGRELLLACQLLVEIVRLRRELSVERRRRRALANLADRDPLTGLANRRKWDRELAERLKALHSAETAAVLGVLLLDLDLFKELNDQCGYVKGDAVLQRIAHQLAANIAPQHLAARLGGDEFGVMISGLLATDVPVVSESLRAGLEYRCEMVDGFSPKITASAGVVVVSPADRVRGVDVLRAADAALRLAKQEGRDGTVVGDLA